MRPHARTIKEMITPFQGIRSFFSIGLIFGLRKLKERNVEGSGGITAKERQTL
jgi:hypothetical protein